MTTSDYTETHTIQSSHADLEITARGSFSEGNVSVGFSMTYDVLFGNFADELMIVEDGARTTHELLQTDMIDSRYTHSLSASATDDATDDAITLSVGE